MLGAGSSMATWPVVGLVTGPCSSHFSVDSIFSRFPRFLSFMLLALIHIVWRECVLRIGASEGPVPEPVSPPLFSARYSLAK